MKLKVCSSSPFRGAGGEAADTTGNSNFVTVGLPAVSLAFSRHKVKSTGRSCAVREVVEEVAGVAAAVAPFGSGAQAAADACRSSKIIGSPLGL
mgnify:CR=1 FL=1